MNQRGIRPSPVLRDAPDPVNRSRSRTTPAVSPDANADERPHIGAQYPAVTSGGGRVPPYITGRGNDQNRRNTVDPSRYADRKIQELDERERYELVLSAANGLRDPSARAQLILLVGIAGRTDIPDEVRGRETAAAYWKLVALLKDSPAVATGPRRRSQQPGANRRGVDDRR